MPKLLTKSNYLLGLQCSKLLWVAKNDKGRIPEPDFSARHNFEVGDIIGVLATKVFPGGKDLADLDFMDNIAATKKAVKNRETIYEAGFMVGGLFSRGDVLLPVGSDEWDIIEVKSATKVKDINFHDVSFQKYVYEKAGLKIRNCYLMHLNSEYIKDGNIEVDELFVQTDITEKVEEFSEGIEGRIDEMKKVITGEEPEFLVEDVLTTVYDNVCLDEFMGGLPEGNVFEFYRMLKAGKVELYKDGVLLMKDVPESVKLSERQRIQRRLARSKASRGVGVGCVGVSEDDVHVDKLAIKNFLGGLKYPIYYLDFETVAPALPKFDGMRPYQRVPFQFSLHIESKDGSLRHYSFLADGISDPRKEFMMELERLLGKRGSIVVYNQSFERGVMDECATFFPEYREWYDGNISKRIKDLLDVFRDFDYYDPRQKGSASIKAVLPVLSDLKYSDLDIGNGMFASLEYERVTYDPSVSDEERKKVRDDLEKYCELDTLAEVEIVKALGEVVGDV